MSWTLLAIAATGTVLVIAWLRRRFAVVDVEGRSMEPTLRTGDRVLVRRVPLRQVRAGDIVVVHTVAATPGGSRVSGRHWLIKRAVALPGDLVPALVAEAIPAEVGTPVPDDSLIVVGDNLTESYDSRVCGYLPGDGLLGVVVRPMSRRSRPP